MFVTGSGANTNFSGGGGGEFTNKNVKEYFYFPQKFYIIFASLVGMVDTPIPLLVFALLVSGTQL